MSQPPNEVRGRCLKSDWSRSREKLTDGVSFAVPVQYVQRGDEELVSILLLITREVTCVGPHQVQQPEGNVGRTVARVELRTGRKGRKRRGY